MVKFHMLGDTAVYCLVYHIYQAFHARSACKTLELESLRLIVGFATSVMVVYWGLVSVQKRE